MMKKHSLAVVLLLGLSLSSIEAEPVRRGRRLKGIGSQLRYRESARTKNVRRLDGKAGKGDGKSGGKGGKSGGSGNGSYMNEAWRDGKYYGCLALSADQRSEMRAYGDELDCEFVSHANSTSRTSNSEENYDSDSASTNETNEYDNAGGTGNDDDVSYYYEEGSGNQTEANQEENANENQGGSSGSEASNQSSQQEEYTNYNYDDTNKESANASGNESGQSEYENYQGYEDDSAGGEDNGQDSAENNGGAVDGQQENGNNANQSSNSSSQADEVVTSVENGVDPYSAFDIARCDTYENLWTWDIELSCGNSTEYYDCHCTFAEMLMERGLLTCNDSENCPNGCPVCSNCLKLMGCEREDSDPMFAGSTGSSNSSFATRAAVLTVLVGMTCCAIFDREKKAGQGKLNAHLIGDNSDEPHQSRIWIVPVDNGIPTETGTSMKPVWLAPEEGSVPGDKSSSISTATSYACLSKDKTKNEAGAPSEQGGVASSSKQRMLDALRFPDILAPTAPEEQVLPQRRVPTTPTDVTGESCSSVDEDCSQELRKKSFVSPCFDHNESHDKKHGYDEESSSRPPESLSELLWSSDDSTSYSSVSRVRNGLPPHVEVPSSARGEYNSQSTITNSMDCEEGSV